MHKKIITSAIVSLVAIAGIPAQAHAQEANLDLRGYQWHLDTIGAKNAWSVTRGAGATIAVIDSGIDPTHPNLAPNLLDKSGAAYHIKYANPDTKRMYDIAGHGTHVAGIAAAADTGSGVVGVAPDSKIYTIKIIPDIRVGKPGEEPFNIRTRIADTIRDAYAHGARVANMSFGAAYAPTSNPDESPICQGIKDVADLDILLIAAAGNDGWGENMPSLPANCEGVMSVAALNSDDRPASFTTFNESVDISAPGEHILSTGNQANSRYQYNSGTSMAAPIVTGVAALVRAAHPDWNKEQVREHLIATARDVYAPGPDSVTGAGAVDASAALAGIPSTPSIRTLKTVIGRDSIKWTPPAAPIKDYTVSIVDGANGSVLSTSTLGARATFFGTQDIQYGTPGNWVTVTANMADGSTVGEIVSPWGSAIEENADDATPKNISVKRGPNNLLLAEWTNPDSARALGVTLVKNGRPVYQWFTSSEVEENGVPSHHLMPEQFDKSAEYQVFISAVGLSGEQHDGEKHILPQAPVYWEKQEIGGLVKVSAKIAGSIAKEARDTATDREGDFVKVTFTSKDGRTSEASVSARLLADGSLLVVIPAHESDTITIGSVSKKVSSIR